MSDIVTLGKSATAVDKSFEIYAKMQIFNALRKGKHRKCLAKSIVAMIQKKTKDLQENDSEFNFIFIDQIKNIFEYELLSYIYGNNYIQVGLFSTPSKRNKCLEQKFSLQFNRKYEAIDGNELENILKKTEISLNGKNISLSNCIDDENFINRTVESYLTEIRSDCSSSLIKKDFYETDKSYKDTGQYVSKAYHRSHFYFDLDRTETELKEQVNHFLQVLLGKNQEYPTQNEFAMSLATQASVRSNFPHRRHVGAALLSEHGEVISLGSIRAPSDSPNTQTKDLDKISAGYEAYKNEMKVWDSFFTELQRIDNTSMNLKTEISLASIKKLQNFVSSSLDFHPCTHAEIAAVLDAAKLGVSIRGATLYTTVYPCHLCAKDIISGGINEVVYLEAYPKSKNDELYPHNITDHDEMSPEKMIFAPFFGVGPERFYFYYSLENKPEDKVLREKWKLHYANSGIISKKQEEILQFSEDDCVQNTPIASLLVYKEDDA